MRAMIDIRILASLAAVVALAGAARAEEPSVRVSVPKTATAVPSGGVGAGSVRVEIARGFHIYAPNETGYIALTIASTMGSMQVLAELPAAKKETLLGEEVPVFEGTFDVKVAVRDHAGRPIGTKLDIPLEIGWQACASDHCENPSKLTLTLPIEIVAPVSGGSPPATPPEAVTTGAVIAPSELATAATPPTTGPPRQAAPASAGDGGIDKSFLWTVLGALLAGLGVTLTPCVFPVIPVTIGYFQQQAEPKEGEKKRSVVPLALAYGLGITAMYAALGVAAARLGQDLGALLGNRWVDFGFVALFAAFAASMFGAFDIALPSSLQTRLSSGERSGVLGALVLGLTLGLVAAPCTGPVAGGLIIIVAQTGNLLFGLATFGAFGLGIAIPFMALGIFSGAAAAMPRPGAWMESVKHVFGFLLLGFAVFYVDVALGDQRIVFALGGALMLVAGGSALRAAWKSVGSRRLVMGGLSIVAAIALLPAGAWLLLGPYVLGNRGSIPTPARYFASKIDWLFDHDAALKLARDARMPVMIDFTARYCLPCRELDATTWRDEAVVRALNRFVAVELDATDAGSENARLKHEIYKAPYWPYIAFYDSRGQRLDALAFQGKPSTEELLARLKEID